MPSGRRRDRRADAADHDAERPRERRPTGRSTRRWPLDLEVRTVPSVEDLLDGSVDAYRVRRVRVEDLLRRPMVTEHAAAVEEIIRDRTVLITGGAGSIGSELARQVFAIGPRRLILVDRAESPLYLRAARARERGASGATGAASWPSTSPTWPAGRRWSASIAREAPSVIFHAAAYKHVPMMEEHPSDAVHVNIGGTLVLLDAAEAAGVERFVFVSTDKAVRPSSVMGASKRIAEMLVADAARRTGRPYVSVRFGNVLGSTGSVVPIFQEQLENGEPLTITHPDMTRYFMTIPEAAWLILDAAALGRDGDLFVLDMGEPVRVMDLARDLVRLAGRDPDSQPIEIVGLRPGEKLHEELFYDAEQVEPTASAKVLRANVMPPPASIRDDACRLLAMASGADEPSLRAAILEYVHEREARTTVVSPAYATGTFAAPRVRRDPDGAGARGSRPSLTREATLIGTCSARPRSDCDVVGLGDPVARAGVRARADRWHPGERTRGALARLPALRRLGDPREHRRHPRRHRHAGGRRARVPSSSPPGCATCPGSVSRP